MQSAAQIQARREKMPQWLQERLPAQQWTHPSCHVGHRYQPRTTGIYPTARGSVVVICLICKSQAWQRWTGRHNYKKSNAGRPSRAQRKDQQHDTVESNEAHLSR